MTLFGDLIPSPKSTLKHSPIVFGSKDSILCSGLPLSLGILNPRIDTLINRNDELYNVEVCISVTTLLKK